MKPQPIVSVTYENERISIKISLPYSKCVLRLSCVVHGPIYGRFKGCDVTSLRASSPIWASEASLARTRVLARLVLLAQIGELARRL